MAPVWIVIGTVVFLLLLTSWISDRRTARRGGRLKHSSDTAFEAREGRRDAEVLGNPFVSDVSWSSWSRRNRSGR